MTTESLIDITHSPNTPWELTALSPLLGDLSIPVNTSLSIGRHTDNDVVLAVPQISRRHAKFNQVGNHLYLQDLNSANGTFVNGQRIGGEAVAVSPKDEIGFADLLFVLCLQNQTLAREALETVAEKTANSSPSIKNSPTVPEQAVTEQLVTETVTQPPPVVEAAPILPTATPAIDEPTVAPTRTAPVNIPIEPQTISPVSTTTSSPVLENKNHASKNMWLIAIVIILLIAGLVIAKMVL